MLSFDLRTLDSGAVQVSSKLIATEENWDSTNSIPLDGINVEGRLSAAGEDRFYFSGSISGSVQLDCKRCLTPVTINVQEDIHFLFAQDGDQAVEGDPDVFFYSAGDTHLDIRPAVREAWLLAAPAYAQCSPECKGLCPQCGIDLNVETCNCVSTSTDSRWDALKSL